MLKLAIQDIQTFSVVVSWQPRNHSGIHGFRVSYQSLEHPGDFVKSKFMEKGSQSVKLARLHANARYLVCVTGLTNWSPAPNTSTATSAEMADSRSTRCSQVSTLEPVEGARAEVVHVATGGKASRHVPPEGSILTRRLGLIVGCSAGSGSFLLLVGCLAYLKIKKRRVVKEPQDEPALPQEYVSYQHFSFPNGGEQPSVMGTTTTLIA